MVARPRSPCGALLPQFYAGRDIFITGATGFMGKVLIERLLSTCPDVGRIHLLMRSKKGDTPEKRLLKLKQSQVVCGDFGIYDWLSRVCPDHFMVFDIIRQQNPSQLDKLLVIQGDVAQPGLGIATEYLKQLQEVSIVFHSAATLKFDEALSAAVDQNVLSVLRLMDICDTLPNLQAFVHVSTAYSNPERYVVDEKVYPSPVSLSRLLALVDVVPPPMLASITPQYIKPKPNTYTFTKAMAEEAIRSRPSSYPVAIFRPTIVISSLKNPYPGWIENLNGPSGIVVAAGKGLLHVFCRKPDAKADLIPVDIAIDTLLAVAWETAVDKLSDVRVYNCSTIENPTTWKDFETGLKVYLPEYPLDGCLWYPSGSGVENRYLHKILEFLLHTVPLHVAEYIMRALGVKMKMSLITAEQRLRAMSNVLAFFALRDWQFKNDNVQKLRARLTPSDAAIYNLDPKTIDWNEQYKNFVKGTRKFLLKEKDEDAEEAKKHLNRMFFIHKGVIFFVMILLFRLVLQNKTFRNIVYGTLRLLASLLYVGYNMIEG